MKDAIESMVHGSTFEAQLGTCYHFVQIQSQGLFFNWDSVLLSRGSSQWLLTPCSETLTLLPLFSTRNDPSLQISSFLCSHVRGLGSSDLLAYGTIILLVNNDVIL